MSWLGLAAEDPFGVQTLPYGTVTQETAPPQPAVRIGDFVLPVRPAAERLRPDLERHFPGPMLDAFLAAGPQVWAEVRAAVTQWFIDERFRSAIEPLLIPLADVAAVLPFTVADYVDFYASENHASNVGRMFRPNSEPLEALTDRLPRSVRNSRGIGCPDRSPAGST